ncbi:hypothetical protein ROLI_003560 [Roseobacter fucihabitans]|uniref:Uncharacterized protein n=1 Tax=Roseobacter fucihabitans TaxID=1537242 RepID=A0ABZ2BQW4_9RHOB|nr:hypothetical protein [Roseobacter litoralis]
MNRCAITPRAKRSLNDTPCSDADSQALRPAWGFEETRGLFYDKDHCGSDYPL